MTSRRDFLGSTLAAGGLALMPAARVWSAASPASIEDHFAALMADLGLLPTDTGGAIRFLGREPIFPSATPLATAFALPAMACAAGAAIAWRQRSGQGQDAEIDIARAAHGIFPEMTANPTLNGQPYPGFHTENPIEQSHAYETRDGRFLYASAVYPHQTKAWIRFLGCAATPAAVRAAIRERDAQALEDEANAQSLTACIARSPAEWLAHPQGALLARTPVVDIRKIGDSAAEAWRPGSRPLSGVRVLAGMDGRPALPSTLLINDHVAGYLGAAGAMAALIRRAREGGSYHVSISLTRAAMWYQSLGMMDRAALAKAFGSARHRLPPPEMITRATSFGTIRRLAPAAKLSATPAAWDDPILVPKGSSPARWQDTSLA